MTAHDDWHVRLPSAYMCDIDGTIALMNGRGPYDWHRVGEDSPNMPVIRVIRALRLAGYPVPFVSGRKRRCEKQTRLWISANVCDHEFTCFCSMPLFMRLDDDNRPDEVVKPEMLLGSDQYYDYVARRYNVEGVFDDRSKVVAMWRQLGLTVFDVAGYQQ